MKTKNIMVLAGLFLACITLSGFTSERVNQLTEVTYQEGFIVYATFDGKEDYGYNFITVGKDNEEYTLTFHKVEAEVLKAFDLNSDALVGTKFKITFNKEIIITEDENDISDEEEINTITKLEKL